MEDNEDAERLWKRKGNCYYTWEFGKPCTDNTTSAVDKIFRGHSVMSYVFITGAWRVNISQWSCLTLLQGHRGSINQTYQDAEASAVGTAAPFAIQRSQVTKTATYTDHAEVDCSKERPSNTVQETRKWVTLQKSAKAVAVDGSVTDPLQGMQPTNVSGGSHDETTQRCWTPWQIVYQGHHSLFVHQERIRKSSHKRPHKYRVETLNENLHAHYPLKHNSKSTTDIICGFR